MLNFLDVETRRKKRFESFLVYRRVSSRVVFNVCKLRFPAASGPIRRNPTRQENPHLPVILPTGEF